MSPSTTITVPFPPATYRLTGKNVFIAGGTAGIGAAIAISFAKRGANVYIAGRNAVAAEKVLADAKREARAAVPDAQPSYGFYPFDASSIQDSKRLADELVTFFSSEERGGLHYLFLAQGGIAGFSPFTKRQLTKEGHEWFLAVQDFSRFILAAKLLPILNNTDNGGVVFDILSAGLWNQFDENNMELEGRAAHFKAVASRDGPIHEILALEFNERYPRVKYNHVYPGLVRTSIAGSTDLFTRLLFFILNPLVGVPAEKYGEDAFNNATIWDRYENSTASEDIGEQLLSKRAWQPGCKPAEVQEYPKRPEVRQAVWSFLEAATGVTGGSTSK